MEIIKPDRPHDCQWAAVGAIYAVNKAARVVGLHALEFVIATFFEPHRSAKNIEREKSRVGFSFAFGFGRVY